MGELPVHVPMGPPVVQQDGIKVGPGDDYEVALFQGHIRIKVCRQKPSRFIALNAANEHQRLSG